MQYLVTMDFVDPGPLLPPAQLAEMLEQAVLPGFKGLADLQAAGKLVAGGLLAGARALAFIIEAADNDEADRLVRTNPLWGIVRTTISPLQDFGKRAELDRQSLDQIKACLAA